MSSHTIFCSWNSTEGIRKTCLSVCFTRRNASFMSIALQGHLLEANRISINLTINLIFSLLQFGESFKILEFYYSNPLATNQALTTFFPLFSFCYNPPRWYCLLTHILQWFKNIFLTFFNFINFSLKEIIIYNMAT